MQSFKLYKFNFNLFNQTKYKIYENIKKKLMNKIFTSLLQN